MASNLSEFLEQLIISTFLIKLTQFEQTGSLGKVFIPLGKLITKFHFQN